MDRPINLKMSRLWYCKPNFIFAWLSSIAEGFALSVLMLASSWYVVDQLHQPSALGKVMICGMFPRLILMILGGVIADRVPRRRILFITFWLRAGIVLATAMAAMYGQLSLEALMLSSLAFGTADAFFWPARDALLPDIVDEVNLPRANAAMQGTNWVSMTLGPVAGGVLFARMKTSEVFLIVALSLIFGAIAISFIKLSHGRAGSQGSKASTTMQESIFEAVSYLRGAPELRFIMAIYALANLLFIGPMQLAPPLLSAAIPGLGATGLSVMSSAFGFGMMGGFLIWALCTPTGRPMVWIIVMIIIEGILLAAMGQMRDLVTLALIQFLLGLCIACNNVPMLALVQTLSPKDMIARIMSLYSITSIGLGPLSIALTAFAMEQNVAFSSVLITSGISMSVLITILSMLPRASGRSRAI